MTRDVFLSHRSTDKGFVRQLARDIESSSWQGRRLQTWLDEAEIQPGQSATGMINQGLEESRFVALIMTPAYFESESGWTDAEWHAALYKDPDNRQARILPILAADCPYVPILIDHLIRIDMRGREYDRGLKQLLRAIRDEPFPPPRTFRGQLIRPDARIDRATLIAERSAPDADPDPIEENLSCNLLPIESLPKSVFSGIIVSRYRKPRKDGLGRAFPNKEEVKELLRENQKEVRSPAFRLVEGRIYTFHTLNSPDCPFYPLVEDIRIHKVSGFILNPEDRKIVISLIAMGLERKLFSRNLMLDRSKRGAPRIYFASNGRTERKIAWRPFIKKSVRCVAKPYSQNNRVLFWLHQAAYIKPVFLAQKFYLQITPTWLLTEDGRNVKGGPEVGRVVIRWMGPERNTHILYHVRFWTSVLKSQSGPIEISLGDQKMRVSQFPASIHLFQGIENDQVRLQNALDAEANFIATTEEEAEIEEAPEDDELEQGINEELQEKQDAE